MGCASSASPSPMMLPPMPARMARMTGWRKKVPTVSRSGGRCPLARMTTTVTRMKKTKSSWPISTMAKR